jgi:hypothetical protein
MNIILGGIIMKKNFKGKMYNTMKFIFTFGVVFSALTLTGHAATGIFTKAASFLNVIQRGLLYVSIGAAIIGIATGVLMKKFSMGKQDKIETGNRIIRETVVAVLVINSAPVLVRWLADQAN